MRTSRLQKQPPESSNVVASCVRHGASAAGGPAWGSSEPASAEEPEGRNSEAPSLRSLSRRGALVDVAILKKQLSCKLSNSCSGFTNLVSAPGRSGREPGAPQDQPGSSHSNLREPASQRTGQGSTVLLRRLSLRTPPYISTFGAHELIEETYSVALGGEVPRPCSEDSSTNERRLPTVPRITRPGTMRNWTSTWQAPACSSSCEPDVAPRLRMPAIIDSYLTVNRASLLTVPRSSSGGSYGKLPFCQPQPVDKSKRVCFTHRGGQSGHNKKNMSNEQRNTTCSMFSTSTKSQSTSQHHHKAIKANSNTHLRQAMPSCSHFDT